METAQQVADRLGIAVSRVIIDQDGTILVNTPFTMGMRFVSEAEYQAFIDSAEIEEY